MVISATSAMAGDRVVKVGVYENAPKVFVLSTGEPAGIFVDILEHIASVEGWELVYVPGTWAEGLERLERREIDLMPDVAYSVERADLFSFHKEPVLSSWSQVYAPSGSGIRSIVDLHGKRIAVLEHSVQEGTFKQVAASFGLNITLVSVTDYSTMFATVASGQADAAVANRFYGLLHSKKMGLEDTAVIFDPCVLFFAAPKGDPGGLLGVIDNRLSELKSDTDSEYYRSLKKWTSEDVSFELPDWVKFALFFVGLLVLLGAAGNILLKRQVNLRTRTLLRRNLDFERITDAFVALDRNWRFTYVNARASELLGQPSANLVGADVWGQFPAEATPPIRTACEMAICEQKTVHIEARLATTGRWFDVTIYPSPDGLSVFFHDITARKKAEMDRSAVQRQLEDIIEFLPDATFVIDKEKRVIAWNRACEVMTGVKKEDLIGKGDYAYAEPFFGERRPILVDLLDTKSPEHEQFYKYVRRADGTIVAESYISRLRGGQGAHLWGAARELVDQQGQRFGAIEVIRDVTEQKVVEQALRESELKHRTLFETAGDAILLMRGNRFIDCNAKTLVMFGCARDQIIGKPPFEFSPDRQPDGRSSEESGGEKIEQALLGKPQLFEWEHLRLDGSAFPAEVSLNGMDIGGETLLQAIVRDITERKRAENEVQKLNADLREYAEELEQRVEVRTSELLVEKERAESADRLKSSFLAAMSHELRTPLNSIIGFTGIMLQGLAGPLNLEQNKQLSMVQNSARHLLSLINDVLDISKIESGQLNLSITRFDVLSSIEKAIKLISPLAEQKGIELAAEVPAHCGSVRTDQRRFEQILLNLLNNAVKFTEEGRVVLSCRRETEHLVVSIADTGIGISEEDLPRLFSPFHQIDSGPMRKYEGTGLGLSICKKLLEMMDGSVSVESQLGHGSVFTVRLPTGLGE